MGLGRGTAMYLGASPGSPLPLAARRLGGVLWPPQSPAQPGTVWQVPHCIFVCAALHVSEFPRGAGAALIGCIKGPGRLSALRTLGQ